MGEKLPDTRGRRKWNKQWSETSSATEKLGLKPKFRVAGAWVVSVVEAVEDEVWKWRYFVKITVLSRNLPVKEEER